jgi:cell wall-associated NlpC family hydrolase
MAKRLIGALAIITVTLQLFGCGTLPDKTTGAISRGNVNPAAAVVETARQQVGAPYRYGGSTPKGFDCSGLVHYAYMSAGIEVPRTTDGLLREAHRVSLTQLKPGDILFFRADPPKISHVGIYIGHDHFVHAPTNGKRVSYASLKSKYWMRHIVTAGRYY